MHNNILEEIKPKVEVLFHHVREYESDTFSSSGHRLTDDEAETISARLILNAIQSLIDGDNLDGVMISDILSQLRGKE